MDLGLKGKFALVTGSSKGLGKIIAHVLARENANVIVCARGFDRLLSCVKELKNRYESTNIYGYTVNGTRQESVKSLFSEISRVTPKIDILVNSIGGAEPFGSYDTLKDEDWENAWKLNLMSVKYFCDRTIPLMQKFGGGRIVNLASLPAHQPGKFNPHYATAKAALINYTKSLANWYGKDDILVNSICPSALSGSGFDRNVTLRAKRDNLSIQEVKKVMLAEECAKTPLSRIGDEYDVANYVAFLVSAKAGFITGQCLNVDGGATRSIL